MISVSQKRIMKVFFLAMFVFVMSVPGTVHAQAQVATAPASQKLGISYVGCDLPNGTTGCPTALKNDYYPALGERCAEGATFQAQMDDFEKDPNRVHLWVADPDITAQGKADERARQFIYWVLSYPAIDTHPTIKNVWNFSRNIALVVTLLIASIFGIGIIVAQRNNFDVKVEVSPLIIKLLLMLLYITFSATIVLSIIQLSEMLMKFFIENLGGRDLFNIYFTTNSGEKNYIDFNGCRDLNHRVQEAVDAELIMLKLTNITYYVMGVMILLRKILLWFLLFVSPFLALLMPFVFIRNIGWIWIGVFFQWVFYGPLFALFLGGLAQIWKNGIPFPFNFGRTNTFGGYVYPSGINIAYGGPAQEWTAARPPYTNNGNYIDTFAEYVITLIMLWAVTFFPWWLLRIFRDYCCDGILAMKNILLSMYDQMRGGPSPTPPTPTPAPTTIGTALKIQKDMEIPLRVKLETIEEVKKAHTEEISKTLQLSATKLTDVAHFETNKTTQTNIRKNIELLQNPMKADTNTEKQKFINIRTELFNRSVKQDTVARNILTATSTSRVEQMQRREELIKTLPEMKPITHVVSVKVQMPTAQVNSVTSSFINSISNQSSVVNNISKQTQTTEQQVKTVLQSVSTNISKPTNQVITNVAKETGVEKEKVVRIVKVVSNVAQTNKEVVKEVATKEHVKEEQVQKVITAQVPAIAEPEKNVEQTVAVPPSVSLEDYEEVKTMWQDQYEKGEVPVSENIKSRAEWIDKDIVLITNTLNKLMSADEKVRQEGLDDIGYLLPIFMINNLTGEELIVYLKAKLEAAKAVLKKNTEKAEEKQEQKEEEEEVLVENKQKKEEEKTMTLEDAQEIPEESKPTPIESETQPTNPTEQQPVNQPEQPSSTKTEIPQSLISKLEESADKNKTS